MKVIKEAIGNRYGKLVVIERAERDKRYTAAMWLCKCDCGKEKVVRGGALRIGQTLSCGCLSKFPKGEAAFRAVFSGIKQGAHVKNLEFSLTEQQVREVQQRPCCYCGALPANGKGKRNGERCNGAYVYNGLDRVDNTKGYTTDNIVSCCWKCNKAKGKMSRSEFLSWIKKVAAYNI